jgi:hypothetical protein
MRKYAKFWRYVRRLKKDFPLNHSVSIRTFKTIKDENGHRLFGDCELVNGKFLIRIARSSDESVMIDTFWHEISHALVGVEHGHKRCFWDQYSKIYRHYLEDHPIS